MTFVHGHGRDAGWVVSHYRRPRRAGSSQLDLDLPTPRDPEAPGADAPDPEDPGPENLGSDDPGEADGGAAHDPGASGTRATTP